MMKIRTVVCVAAVGAALAAAGCGSSVTNAEVTAAASTVGNLTHEYVLSRGSLEDFLGGPSLEPVGGGHLSSGAYVFGPGEGPTLTGALSSGETYSIEVIFRFASVDGYRRILEQKQPRVDNGWYVLDGTFDYYDNQRSPHDIAQGPQGAIQVNQDVDVVITRDGSTNEVACYANGVLQYSFIDTTGSSTFDASGNEIEFFNDNGGENSAGVLHTVRIFDAALDQAEVSDLFARSGL
ncbi:MAG TPA: LamG-like jellyroll fold domain-containing protein [Planctomycetota bacterium]|nr:LamG-like jellyroll fold domain-containing protein [Planctomycetota bacterium]